MGILRADRVSGLGGANAINGSVKFASDAGAGQGTYLEVSDPDGDIKFGTSDWTIEFWMNASTIDTSAQENDLATILDFGYGIGSGASATGAWFAVHQEDATLWLGFNNANQVQSSSFLTANTWHHIAITRTSNTAKIYGDGTQVATVSCSQDFTDATWRFLDIGSQPASGVERNFDGHISNLRIVKGTAIYTSAFTPPTTRLEKTSDTVLLCCQSPGNVFKEETGKSIAIGTVSKTPGPTASHFAPDKGEDHGTTLADGATFNTLSYMVPPGGRTDQRGRGRGVFGGGYTSVPTNAAVKRIYYIEIASMGTGADFGDLTGTRYAVSGNSSSTRGLFNGGTTPTNLDTIEYITIATTSNALDFGDLNIAHGYGSSCSNNTRGLTGGGRSGSPVQPTAEIDYVTIATLGNGQDFGDLTQSRMGLGAFASSTRGLFTGGSNAPQTPRVLYNIIDYVTIASTGNAQDFGDLTSKHEMHGSASSPTRGIAYGGRSAPSTTINIIEYITIATLGDGVDFGDVRDDGAHAHGTSNSARGVFAGGTDPYRNSIDFITIATTGNGVDWGDLPITNGSYAYAAGLSDSHGGIS